MALGQNGAPEILPWDDVASCKERLGVLFDSLIAGHLSDEPDSRDIQAEIRKIFPDEGTAPDWLLEFVMHTITNTASNWAHAVAIVEADSEL